MISLEDVDCIGWWAEVMARMGGRWGRVWLVGWLVMVVEGLLVWTLGQGLGGGGWFCFVFIASSSR